VNQTSRYLHRQLNDDGVVFYLSTTKPLIEKAGFTRDKPPYAQMVRGPNTEARVIFCKNLVDSNDKMNNIIFLMRVPSNFTITKQRATG